MVQFPTVPIDNTTCIIDPDPLKKKNMDLNLKCTVNGASGKSNVSFIQMTHSFITSIDDTHRAVFRLKNKRPKTDYQRNHTLITFTSMIFTIY